MSHPKVRTGDIVPNRTATAGAADNALTVADSVVQHGLTLHAETTHIMFDVQTAAVRFTVDGSDPSASNGHRMEAGDSATWPRIKMEVAKFIRESSTSAVIHMSQMTE